MPVELALPCLVLLCLALVFMPPGPKQEVRVRGQEWFGSE